ncbi:MULTISPECIES: class I SAM-dependent methyltransferase [Amycolatopsis]|uniref:Methyltransferase domain-containing protein n=2 Tax=Amycolatopsis TaxID=1813 RepID=A0A1I3YNS0_9PSEU|nr:methyltransferase domain-containing protein [Amycolatopsis sacchari]SFK32921.1 Methyltransferase domain-containing protein [Amycolatopsis sacchari]
MPFDHNSHYHPLLLRHVPPGARRALDVGCGTGRFARRLAEAGLEVDAVDPDADVIAAARALGGGICYRQEDVTEAELGRYDFISCLASLHHMPFETVTKLRDALNPGGVLVVLGLAKPRSAADFAQWHVLSPPLNLLARAVVAAGERLNGGPDHTIAPRVRDWTMTMTQVRRESARLLPGSTVRPVLFWRYLLVYRLGWSA